MMSSELYLIDLLFYIYKSSLKLRTLFSSMFFKTSSSLTTCVSMVSVLLHAFALPLPLLLLLEVVRGEQTTSQYLNFIASFKALGPLRLFKGL